MTPRAEAITGAIVLAAAAALAIVGALLLTATPRANDPLAIAALITGAIGWALIVHAAGRRWPDETPTNRPTRSTR